MLERYLVLIDELAILLLCPHVLVNELLRWVGLLLWLLNRLMLLLNMRRGVLAIIRDYVIRYDLDSAVALSVLLPLPVTKIAVDCDAPALVDDLRKAIGARTNHHHIEESRHVLILPALRVLSPPVARNGKVEYRHAGRRGPHFGIAANSTSDANGIDVLHFYPAFFVVNKTSAPPLYRRHRL